MMMHGAATYFLLYGERVCILGKETLRGGLFAMERGLMAATCSTIYT